MSARAYDVVALLGGACLCLAFAPVHWWPLSFVAPAVLYGLLETQPVNKLMRLAFLFGFGVYLGGASWIYVSIHDYGYTGMPLAVLMTGLFCAFMGSYYLGFAWLYRRFLRPAGPFAFAGLWVLQEWFRGWFLTGFPWLYVGYAHVDSPLAWLAPIGGVWAVSLAAVWLGAAALNLVLKPRSWHYALPALILVFIGLWLPPSHWTGVSDRPAVTVGMVQADIPQLDKWSPEYLRKTITTHTGMSRELWGDDIIIWPESAITLDYLAARDLLQNYSNIAADHGSTLVTGIPYISEDFVIHNSITSLGLGSGLYFKQRLVPFGEYVPLQHWLRGLIRFFDLPMSDFTPGPAGQALLTAGPYKLAPFICYELVYPEFVTDNLRDAEFIVTISNDSWFGASWGPLQHLQMAQMRALEHGRYVLRATNNGVSAIIDAQGRILQQTPQFEPAILRGEARVMNGQTPFSRWGSYPVLVIAAVAVLWGVVVVLRNRQFGEKYGDI